MSGNIDDEERDYDAIVKMSKFSDLLEKKYAKYKVLQSNLDKKGFVSFINVDNGVIIMIIRKRKNGYTSRI